MKTIHIILTAILSLSILISCETTEKIDDFPLRPSQLVVNCFFADSAPWEFQVSKSLSVLDNADIRLVNNASVSLYKDGSLLSVLNQAESDGWYRLYEYLPEKGSLYKIEVSSPDFTRVLVAEESLPLEATIDEVTLMVKDSTFWEWTDGRGNIKRGGNLHGSFHIRFSDPPESDNYYEVYVFSMDTSYNDYENPDDYEVHQTSLWLSTEDPSVDKSSSGGRALLLTDLVFDGQQYLLKADFEDYSATRDVTYYVCLTSLSRSAYIYKQTINAYKAAVNDPFAEPVQIFSNIANGYGIFAGQALVVYPVSL